MTALNPDLLRRVEQHTENVSRLVAHTAAIVGAGRQPGPDQSVQCAGAATVCAQLADMIDRRCQVFRETPGDAALRGQLQEASGRLTMLATLIRARAIRSSLEAELDESFGHLAAALLAVDRIRHPAAAW